MVFSEILSHLCRQTGASDQERTSKSQTVEVNEKRIKEISLSERNSHKMSPICRPAIPKVLQNIL